MFVLVNQVLCHDEWFLKVVLRNNFIKFQVALILHKRNLCIIHTIIERSVSKLEKLMG